MSDALPRDAESRATCHEEPNNSPHQQTNHSPPSSSNMVRVHSADGSPEMHSTTRQEDQQTTTSSHGHGSAGNAVSAHAHDAGPSEPPGPTTESASSEPVADVDPCTTRLVVHERRSSEHVGPTQSGSTQPRSAQNATVTVMEAREAGTMSYNDTADTHAATNQRRRSSDQRHHHRNPRNAARRGHHLLVRQNQNHARDDLAQRLHRRSIVRTEHSARALADCPACAVDTSAPAIIQAHDSTSMPSRHRHRHGMLQQAHLHHGGRARDEPSTWTAWTQLSGHGVSVDLVSADQNVDRTHLNRNLYFSPSEEFYNRFPSLLNHSTLFTVLGVALASLGFVLILLVSLLPKILGKRDFGEIISKSSEAIVGIINVAAVIMFIAGAVLFNFARKASQIRNMQRQRGQLQSRHPSLQLQAPTFELTELPTYEEVSKPLPSYASDQKLKNEPPPPENSPSKEEQDATHPA